MITADNADRVINHAFLSFCEEVEDLASNLLSRATEDEKKELLANCNGQMSEWGWVKYVMRNMPDLKKRIAAEMLS